jgi:hypothetical protein
VLALARGQDAVFRCAVLLHAQQADPPGRLIHLLRERWAFCDLETESAIADLHTLSKEDLKKVVEPLTLRATQFCIFVNALLGEDATERIMQQAVRCAKESSASPSGE